MEFSALEEWWVHQNHYGFITVTMNTPGISRIEQQLSNLWKGVWGVNCSVDTVAGFFGGGLSGLISQSLSQPDSDLWRHFKQSLRNSLCVCCLLPMVMIIQTTQENPATSSSQEPMASECPFLSERLQEWKMFWFLSNHECHGAASPTSCPGNSHLPAAGSSGLQRHMCHELSLCSHQLKNLGASQPPPSWSLSGCLQCISIEKCVGMKSIWGSKIKAPRLYNIYLSLLLLFFGRYMF